MELNDEVLMEFFDACEDLNLELERYFQTAAIYRWIRAYRVLKQAIHDMDQLDESTSGGVS